MALSFQHNILENGGVDVDRSELKAVLERHRKWRSGEGGGKRADLSRANLRGADLGWADLRGANLSGANLYGANLYEADLRGADLSGADLSGANLRGADLREANLSGANLSGADLGWADLSGACFSPLNLLNMKIGTVSDELTLELMRWDARVCGQAAMTAWAKGGPCPFSDNVQRPFLFQERREVWKRGKPKLDLFQLWQAVAKELRIKL